VIPVACDSPLFEAQEFFHSIRSEVSMASENNGLSRREFLKTGAIAAAATGMALPMAPGDVKNEPPVDPKKILNYHPDMRYRRLGKSDIFLSVISLGGIGIEKSVIQYAIDRGVNLVHMSGSYNHGNSIKLLGDVMKTKRNRVYIALKDTFSNIDDDLKVLNTDHVDFLMFNRHSPSDVTDPGVSEDFAKYKQAGKALAAGLTTHNKVKECVAAGIQCGQYAIIQPTLNQNAFDSMQAELQQAAEKGVGIMGMKTMQGIGEMGLELANLKKILANPGVVTVSRVLRNFDHFNEYTIAVKESLSMQEDASLYRHANANRSTTCMMCGACEDVCPQRIGISTVLRSKYYYEDQLHDHDTAIEAFREAVQAASQFSACKRCGRCEPACPNGIPIVDRLARASRFFEYAST
jgi:predicted aldo/keto reductase-like oxidoreductase